jgi:hypothetical protein
VVTLPSAEAYFWQHACLAIEVKVAKSRDVDEHVAAAAAG